jgi:hypothetical protein
MFSNSWFGMWPVSLARSGAKIATPTMIATRIKPRIAALSFRSLAQTSERFERPMDATVLEGAWKSC